MATYVPSKRATEFIFYIGLESVASAGTFQTNPTLAAGDVKISKDGGALTNLATLPVVTPAGGKLVKVTVSSSETDADNYALVFSDASGGEWKDLIVNVQTAARQIDDLAYPNTSGRGIDVTTGGGVGIDWGNVENPTTTVALTGTTAGLIDNAITAAKIATDAITAAKIADGAIDAATFAAGAITAVVIATDAIDADALADGAITPGTFAANAITNAAVADDVVVGSVAGAVGSVAGNVGGNVNGNVVGSVGSVASPVTAGTVSDKTGYSLTVTPPTAAQIATAVWGFVVEGSLTALAALRIMFAAMSNKSNGGGTASINFRDLADSKNRISATVDADGNRTSVTVDGS